MEQHHYQEEDKDVEVVLWSADDIKKRVQQLAESISRDFQGRAPLVATGAFVFLADLVRRMTVPVLVDFVRVGSYGKNTVSSGVANIHSDIKIDVKGKHIIVVEDIIDTGITLSTLIQHFSKKGAASISVCTLLDKTCRRKVSLELLDGELYSGFECPDSFVVGYGMDFDEHYRCLPYIGVLKPYIYK